MKLARCQPVVCITQSRAFCESTVCDSRFFRFRAWCPGPGLGPGAWGLAASGSLEQRAVISLCGPVQSHTATATAATVADVHVVLWPGFVRRRLAMCSSPSSALFMVVGQRVLAFFMAYRVQKV